VTSLSEFGAAAAGVSATLLVVPFGFVALAAAFRLPPHIDIPRITIPGYILAIMTAFTLSLFVSLSITVQTPMRGMLLSPVRYLCYMSLIAFVILASIGVFDHWKLANRRKIVGAPGVLRFAMDAIGIVTWLFVISAFVDINGLHLSPTSKPSEYVSSIGLELFSGLIYVGFLGWQLLRGLRIRSNE
jgi:hypothetical protein